ncbi:MAG: hypothetical protein WD468_08240, partial [Pirellulales bacterium]
IHESDLTSTLDGVLADTLLRLFLDVARGNVMAAAMRRLAQPDASSQITDSICDILCTKTKRMAA